MKKFFVSAALVLSLFTCPLFAQNKPDALAEYRRGNWSQAVTICTQEIAENSENLESYVVLCWSLAKLGRYDEALKYAEKGHLLNHYDVRIIEILGEIKYQTGYNNEALRYFQEYVNLAPEGQRIDVVYYFIGEIYIRMGWFRHADIALSTALHYAPNNAMWWTRLAYTRENSGDLREAVRAYEKALSLDSQLTDAQRGLNRVRTVLVNR